jgi:hypothetical protein
LRRSASRLAICWRPPRSRRHPDCRASSS